MINPFLSTSSIHSIYDKIIQLRSNPVHKFPLFQLLTSQIPSHITSFSNLPLELFRWSLQSMHLFQCIFLCLFRVLISCSYSDSNGVTSHYFFLYLSLFPSISRHVSLFLTISLAFLLQIAHQYISIHLDHLHSPLYVSHSRSRTPLAPSSTVVCARALCGNCFSSRYGLPLHNIALRRRRHTALQTHLYFPTVRENGWSWREVYPASTQIPPSFLPST